MTGKAQVFERSKLDGIVCGDGIDGAVHNEFFKQRETDWEEHKGAEEHKKGVYDAHTWGYRTQDPLQRRIDILFTHVLGGERLGVTGGVSRVGRDEYTIDTAQVGWYLVNEVRKRKKLPLSNYRDRL